jgi:hypothetical protein
MSACPAWRVVSLKTWTNVLNKLTSGRGHQGT